MKELHFILQKLSGSEIKYLRNQLEINKTKSRQQIEIKLLRALIKEKELTNVQSFIKLNFPGISTGNIRMAGSRLLLKVQDQMLSYSFIKKAQGGNNIGIMKREHLYAFSHYYSFGVNDFVNNLFARHIKETLKKERFLFTAEFLIQQYYISKSKTIKSLQTKKAEIKELFNKQIAMMEIFTYYHFANIELGKGLTIENYIKKIKELCKEYQIKTGVPMYTSLSAENEILKGNYNKAEGILKNSLMKSIKDPAFYTKNRIGTILGDLGLAQVMKKDYRNARKNMTMSLSHFENGSFNEYVCHFYITTIDINMNEYDKAATSLNNLMKHPKDKIYNSSQYLESCIHLKTENYKKALKILARTRTSFAKTFFFCEGI